MLGYLQAKLKALVEDHVPMTNPRDYNEPWMNNLLMRQWKNKYFAWKRFTETKSHTSYVDYKKETNLLKKATCRAKKI